MCKCSPECFTAEFNVKTNIGTPANYKETSGTAITVYYDTFDYTLIKQEPKITLVDLFGSIGGILGLLIGGSIISIIELIEFAASLFFLCINNQKNKKIGIKFFQKTNETNIS